MATPLRVSVPSSATRPGTPSKLNSKEFFSSIDPLYRAYGKQDALAKQKGIFAAAPGDEERWLDYCAYFKSMSNWIDAASHPFGERVTTRTDDDGTVKRTHDFPVGERGPNSFASSAARHAAWAKRRAAGGGDAGYADPEHPFVHQGSADINLYKCFTEMACALVGKGGRIGLILPSGLYTDQGTTALRTLLLNRYRWEWLFVFENRDFIFDIHHAVKFNAAIIAKTCCAMNIEDAIRTAFMRFDLDDWALGVAEALAVPYARAQVERFSPKSKSILEIRSGRDLAVLEKIYANSVLLGHQDPGGWGITYATEFHMTADSILFPPRPKWEDRGYRPDEYSRWIMGDWRPIAELWAELGVSEGSALRAGPADDAPFQNAPPYQTLPIPRAEIPEGLILSRDITAFIREEAIDWEVEIVEDGDGNEVEVRHRAVALPLYEGRMIGQFDFSEKGWVSGKGRTAVWRDIEWTCKQIEPQYLMAQSTCVARGIESHGLKTGFMDVTGATNTRSVVATALGADPCGHKVPILATANGDTADTLACTGLLNSVTFDHLIRRRLGGQSLTWGVLAETPVKASLTDASQNLAAAVRGLVLSNVAFASLSLRAAGSEMRSGILRPSAWRSLWAITRYERLRLRCIVDAAFAALYGLDLDDLKWILKDCDHPTAVILNRAFFRTLDPKGFWRVDNRESPERRLTVLALAAFADLQALIAAVTAAGGTRDGAIAGFCGQATNPLPRVNGLIGSIDAREGWMLPEHFRLADLGLGHDDRAEQPQPVAATLGPRFYDWQLSQDAAESWRECELHARNLLGKSGFEKLKQS